MIINMVGGGGGFSASNAILGVTAYAGSIVTISNGTVTKSVTPDRSHVLSNNTDYAIYYFGIPSGMFSSTISWNIVATYQGEDTTGTVIINTNAFYDVELTYIVPYDYQQVEYLQSNGNQYIDTLIKTDNIGFMKCKFMCLPMGWVAVPRYTFGGTIRIISGTDQLDGGFGWDWYLMALRVGASAHYFNTGFNIMSNFELSFLNNNRYAKLNEGTSNIETSTPSPTYNGNFYLFTINISNTPSLTDQNSNRIYECEISDYQNQKIANLVPCYRKSDNVAGMYDNVNKRFLTNQGTGTFVVGSDVNS